MKKWVVKKNDKMNGKIYLVYLGEEDKCGNARDAWIKDINKAILYDDKPNYNPEEGEEVARVEVSVKEIK